MIKTKLVIKGYLTVFFFLHNDFSDTWTANMWFHVFWGFKIETKGGFIETRSFGGCGGLETRGFGGCEAEGLHIHQIPLVSRPSHLPNTPGLNEYHLFVSIFEYPKKREYHKFAVQISMNIVMQNKKNM